MKKEKDPYAVWKMGLVILGMLIVSAFFYDDPAAFLEEVFRGRK